MTLVKLRCRCGCVRGSVDFCKPSRVHVVCHCDDCQAYARQIGSPDATGIVQTTPAEVKFLAGTEHVRCLRLTRRGLTRWFTACCRTPLANTSRHAWMPFVGVMRCVLDIEDDDALLGPVTPVNGPHPVSWVTIVRGLRSLLFGVLLARHRPNPFFTNDGRLIARPEVLR
jgi:hypothetical protein